MNSLLQICFFAFAFTLGGTAINGPATGVGKIDGVEPMDRDTTTELHMGEFPFFEGTLSGPVSLRDLNPDWLTNPDEESEFKATKSPERKPLPPLDLKKQAKANDDQTESVPLPTLWTYELLDEETPAKGGYLRTSELPYAYLFYHDEGGLMLTSENYIEVKSNGVIGFNPTELVWVMEFNLEESHHHHYRIRPANHPGKSLMLDEDTGVPRVEANQLVRDSSSAEKESTTMAKKKAADKPVFTPAPAKPMRLWRFNADTSEKNED